MSEKMCAPFGLSVLKTDSYINESANFVSGLLTIRILKSRWLKILFIRWLVIAIAFLAMISASSATLMNHKISIVFRIRFDHFRQKLSGALDFILTIPCELTLTQSYIYTRQLTSMAIIDGQANKISSTNTAIDEEFTALNSVKNLVQNGEIFTGDYHGVIAVYGKTAKEAYDNAISVESAFSAAGYVLLRATDEQETVFISTLPDADAKKAA